MNATPPTTHRSPQSPGYFHSIDGLRLLASVNIVLFHLCHMGGLNELGGRPGWLFTILKGPMFHASLFFILAGFLFTVKYSRYGTSFNTRTFIKGRLSDHYPLHAFTTLLMAAILVITTVPAEFFSLKKLLLSLGVHLSMGWSIFPVFSYQLNTPSWALSAFFFCYLFFGIALRIVLHLKSRGSVVKTIVVCFIPIIGWAVLYSILGNKEWYSFFHVFAPVRFFEFFLGMLLARLYFLNNSKPRTVQVQDIPLLNDGIIVLMVALLYVILRFNASPNPGIAWIAYHVLPLPIYATILYRLARGNGIIARLFAIPVVRRLGKCSFYPYLLHVPLVSLSCLVAEQIFGYQKLLHSLPRLTIVMILLYGASYLLWSHKSKRRKKTYRVENGSVVPPS